MKQFKLYSGMAAVCAMLALASCGNDIELTEAQAPVKGEYKVTFTASQESSATRTAVDGANVVWQEGDAITVFDGAGVACPFELAKGAGETLGEFEGTITVTEPKKYCAVYPAVENAAIDSDYGISGLSLPVEQVATPDGFDPMAAIMTARNDNADRISSESGDLSLGEFKHVCAFVKVTTTEEYDKITFTAKGGERIAGGFTAYVGEGGVSSVEPDDNASTTVSLVPASGETTIAAGTYLIAVLPGTLAEGFTMSCSKDDVEHSKIITMMRSYNGVVGETVFARHNVVNMGTVEETATAVTWGRSEQEYVDLGLSVKWATMNVGATSPEGYGDYFAWGETSTKDDYSWETYKWCDTNNNNSMTKYDATDGKTILDACDDAAHINWGGAWRMPTDGERQELFDKCYWEWTENYGNVNTDNPIKGFIVYKAKHPDDKGKIKFEDSDMCTQVTYDSSTDTHIFLPAAGYRNGTNLGSAGSYGYYWLASLRENSPSIAWNVYFNSGRVSNGSRYRFGGHSVRPVLP